MQQKIILLLGGDYFPGKDMLDLERERIKSADKRTEIARLAIEVADKRMFDYYISKLDREATLRATISSRKKLALRRRYFHTFHPHPIVRNVFLWGYSSI